MNNGKLFRLIGSFSSKERRDFDHFLAIRVHGSKAHLRKMYSILREHFDIKGLAFSKEYLWERTFGDKVYRDDFMRKYCSDLAKFAEDFIAFESFHQNPVRKLEYLLAELDRRGLDKEFAQNLKLARNHQAATTSRDTAYYHSQHSLADQLNRFISKQGKRTKHTNLQEAAQNLDHYYLINKLKY